MLVAYVTSDEVNRHVATQMADICGVALHSLSFKDPRPDGRYNAVLYDVDSLSPLQRRELLVDLVSERLPWPVAVHSRNLEEKQVEALRRNRVAVFRCGIVSNRRWASWPAGHSRKATWSSPKPSFGKHKIHTLST
jgi:hypothetical protein